MYRYTFFKQLLTINIRICNDSNFTSMSWTLSVVISNPTVAVIVYFFHQLISFPFSFIFLFCMTSECSKITCCSSRNILYLMDCNCNSRGSMFHLFSFFYSLCTIFCYFFFLEWTWKAQMDSLKWHDFSL